jgi:TP901 family phage tail tape measure protein
MAVKTIETRAVISAQDRTGSTFSQVGQKLRGLENNAISASRRMDALARGMSSVGTRMREHADIAARMSAGAAPVAIGGGRWVGKLGGATAGVGGKIREGVSDFASYAMPGAAGYAMGMGGAAVGGLAAGAGAAYGVKQAISFEKAMAEVKKKMDFGPGESIADVENLINKKSLEMGMSRENLAALAAQAGQSGIAFKDLAGFMEIAANASNAWDVTSKEAAQTMAEVRAKTGWANKGLEEYADKVNYLGDISAAAEKDVAKMFGKTSSAAQAAGVNYDSSMAAVTALRSVGMDDDVASRAFGQFASRLRTAGSQSKDAKATFKELGFTTKGLEEGMKTDAMGTIVKFLDKMGKSKDAVKHALAFGGKEWYDEFMLFKDALPEMLRLMDALKSGNWRGSLKKAQDVTKATTENHIDRFKNLMSIVGDRATRDALPVINQGVDSAIKSYDSGSWKYWNPFSAASDAYSNWTTKSTFDRMRGLKASSMDRANSWGMFPQSGLSFSAAGVSGGSAGNVVVPGSTAFGLGGVNEGAASALRTAPANLAAALTAGAGQAAPAPAPVARLEGAAEVTNKIIVEPSPDFIVRVEQSINARGNLRNDAGVTMPQ